MISLGKLKLWKLSLCLVTLLGPVVSTAQVNQLQTANQEFHGGWLGQVSALVTSNLEQTDTPEHQWGSSYSLFLQRNVTENIAMGVVASADKDHKNEREFLFNDPFLFMNIRGARYFDGNLASMTLLRLHLPLSERSRNDTQRNFGVTGGYQLMLAGRALGLNKLSLLYRIYGVADSYEGKTSLSGASNNMLQAGNRLMINYAITSKLFLSLDNTYVRRWTHEFNSTDIFVFDQSLSYMIDDNFTLLLGHTNSGNALAVNGFGSNVDLFDSRSSTVYAGLSASF